MIRDHLGYGWVVLEGDPGYKAISLLRNFDDIILPRRWLEEGKYEEADVPLVEEMENIRVVLESLDGEVKEEFSNTLLRELTLFECCNVVLSEEEVVEEKGEGEEGEGEGGEGKSQHSEG